MCLGGRQPAQGRLAHTALVYRDPAELGREWVDKNPGPVRIAAEPLWRGRDELEATEVIRHEALANLALADAQVQMLCAFDAQGLSASVLANVERTHQAILEPGTGWRPSGSYAGSDHTWVDAERPLAEPEEPLELPVTEDLSRLRREVRHSDVIAGIPAEHRPDLLLAISEAAANALRYDQPPRLLRLWKTDHRVVAEVVGRGRIEDPLTGLRRPSASALRGWGLWTIHQICDLVALRHHAGWVRVRMYMRSR
jgi:anti-sigma regulatory factor (Ser/Thr protein kinase)